MSDNSGTFWNVMGNEMIRMMMTYVITWSLFVLLKECHSMGSITRLLQWQSRTKKTLRKFQGDSSENVQEQQQYCQHNIIFQFNFKDKFTLNNVFFHFSFFMSLDLILFGTFQTVINGNYRVISRLWKLNGAMCNLLKNWAIYTVFLLFFITFKTHFDCVTI